MSSFQLSAEEKLKPVQLWECILLKVTAPASTGEFH